MRLVFERCEVFVKAACVSLPRSVRFLFTVWYTWILKTCICKIVLDIGFKFKIVEGHWRLVLYLRNHHHDVLCSSCFCSTLATPILKLDH